MAWTRKHWIIAQYSNRAGLMVEQKRSLARLKLKLTEGGDHHKAQQDFWHTDLRIQFPISQRTHPLSTEGKWRLRSSQWLWFESYRRDFQQQSGFPFDGEYEWAASYFQYNHLLPRSTLPLKISQNTHCLQFKHTIWHGRFAMPQRIILLTTNRWLFTFFLTAAFQTFPHHHEDVGKNDKREWNSQATAVFLDQEVTLELPHLVIVLLYWSNSITNRQRKRKCIQH